MPARLLLLFLCFSYASCWNFGNHKPFEEKMVLGYVPVYSQDSSLLQIKSIGPQPVEKPGKIYVRGNMLFQNESGKGIHVIDKTDPSNPIRTGFIVIRGNQEMSLKGNYLYANASADIVTLDITDWKNVKEISRLKHVFAIGGENGFTGDVPLPEKQVYFKCIDPGKGIHVGWKKDSVLNTGCYYY